MQGELFGGTVDLSTGISKFLNKASNIHTYWPKNARIIWGNWYVYLYYNNLFIGHMVKREFILFSFQ